MNYEILIAMKEYITIQLDWERYKYFQKIEKQLQTARQRYFATSFTYKSHIATSIYFSLHKFAFQLDAGKAEESNYKKKSQNDPSN